MSRRRKRSAVTGAERAMGVQGATTAAASDWFTNVLARTGYGTPNLVEGTSYELVRFSYDYWQLITLYRNHWISRRIVDTPALDMIRAWPKLVSELTPQDTTKLDATIRKTRVKAALSTALKWGRLFGGAGCLMVIDGHEDRLDTPLDLDEVELNSFKGLIPFDRWAGIYPGEEICTDINSPLDFNKPEWYYVNNVEATAGAGKGQMKVHGSRVLRSIGPEVPTPEREAQSWWGISVLEPVYEEIQKRDNMSWNILNLTFRANILGMKFPQLAQLLSGLGSNQKFALQQFHERMSAVNHLISNQSLVPLPENGSIESTQYSFAGLSDVYQQFQLDISGAAEIPVTRLWGRTITGLGQANDADERIYEEKIAKDQDQDMRPQLEKLYPVLCMSQFGEVPDDVDLAFPSIRVLDEKEKSELAKSTADTVVVALNAGLISPRTGGKELKDSSDVTGVFSNITDEDIEELSEEVTSEAELGAGMFGEGEGVETLDPASSPSRVLKEENKEKKSAVASPPGNSGSAAQKKQAADAALDTLETNFWQRYDVQADVALLDDVLTSHPLPRQRMRRTVDAIPFKESEHPRDKGGKFAVSPGGATEAFANAVSATGSGSGLNKYSKAEHPIAASFIKAAVKENLKSITEGGKQLYTNEEIAKKAQELYGTKTSAFTVNGYKHAAYKASPAGQAELEKLKKNVKVNNEIIAAAPTEPKVVAQAVKTWNTGPVMYASASKPGGEKKFFKITGMPSSVSNMDGVKAYMAQQGYTVVNAGEYSPTKPAPPVGYTDLTVDHSIASELEKKQAQHEKEKTAAAEKAAKEMAAKLGVQVNPNTSNNITKASSPLTDSETAALKSYSNGAYMNLNKTLRGGKKMTLSDAILAKQLDQAIAKHTLEADTTLWRGIGASDVANVIGDNPKVGDVVVDNGFMSTSKATGGGFWSSSQVQMRINAKKGQHAIDIKHLSLHSSENEVVLPRGSLFKIKSLTTSSSGKVVLEVDHVEF